MSHAAKAPKTAKPAKAPKASAGAARSARRTAAKPGHRKQTGPRKTKPRAKKAPDNRGKAHGHRQHEKIGAHRHVKAHHEKKHHVKAHHEHHVTDKAHHPVHHKVHRKHEVHTRYGLHHVAKKTARGVVKAPHQARAAHLPHNGTAHHEQYK